MATKRTLFLVPSLIMANLGLNCFPSFGDQPMTAPPAMMRERSICAIGGRIYTLSELTGHSPTELETQFRAAMKDMPDASLRRLLHDYGGGRVDDKDGALARPDLETAVWQAVYFRYLNLTIAPVALAQMVDRVATEQHADLNDYFNQDAVSDALQRETGLLKFMDLHEDDTADKFPALVEEAKRKFRYRQGIDYWRQTSRMPESAPGFYQWTQDATAQTEKSGRYVTRALLLHALLADVCDHGVYRQRANLLFQFRTGVLRVVDITGYRGDENALRNFLQASVGPRGELPQTSVSRLNLWFRDLCPTVSIQSHNLIGSQLLKGYHAPPVGVLYRPLPDTYRIVGWSDKAPGGDVAPGEQAGIDDFEKVYSYQIATEELMPAIESHVPGWTPDIDLVTGQITVDGPEYGLPEVAIDPYIKKPYPSLVFDECDAIQPDLQEMVIKAIAAGITHDIAAAKGLLAQIDLKCKALKTDQARACYNAVAQRIDKTFNF